VADLVGIDRSGEVIRLMFGQASLSAEKVRSVVIVSLSPDAVRNLLKSLENFLPSFREFFHAKRVEAGQPPCVQGGATPTVALVANLISITFSGREAELDFFHLGA